jgi:hypothetical protein
MSDLSVLNKNLRKGLEGEDRQLKIRNSRVNFSAQYIRVVSFILSRIKMK